MKNLFTYTLFTLAYMSQHIGSGFIAITLVVLLREQGASLAELGCLQLIILPYSLRFLWSPLVDRFGFSRRGHFRNWLLPVQGLITLCWLGLSQLQPLSNFPLLFGLLLFFALMIGTQDLALDGLACTAFDAQERITIGTIQIASGMIGNLIGGGLVILYPYLGWQNALLILAALSLLPLFWIFLYQEPISSPTKTLTLSQSWLLLLLFWRGKTTWLAMLSLYAVSFSGGFAILSPALVDNGWTMEQIGILMNYGVLVGLATVIVIMPLNRKLKRSTSSQIFTFVQMLSLLALLPLALGNATPFWAYLAITACYLSFAPMFATNNATMMDIAAHEPTPTTAYTVQIAVAMLLSILANMLCLQLANYFGYAAVIAASLTAAAVAFFLMPKLLTRLLNETN